MSAAHAFIWWTLALFLGGGLACSLPSLWSELRRSRGFRGLRYHVPADARRGTR